MEEVPVTPSDSQSVMILQMEKKLNSLWFRRRKAQDKLCTISSNQYWDWLTYVDVIIPNLSRMQDDYLTDWEILKMKELYFWQLQELSGQGVAHLLFGWLITYPLMGPMFKSHAYNYLYRFPVAASIAFFLSVQASNWQRPGKSFHELMAQPAPHGSYLRRSIKVRRKNKRPIGTLPCVVEPIELIIA